MGNVFDIKSLGAVLATAKDKALAKAGTYALNDAFEGRVLPPLPPLPQGNKQEISKEKSEDFDMVFSVAHSDTSELEYSIFGTPMCFPLSIKAQTDKEWWLLPIEPIITLSGSNTLIRRNVAKISSRENKRRGTVKERWATDDYTININGLLSRFDDWSYPTDDVAKMRAIVEARSPIDVKCQLFEIFGIGKMVIEKYDFPFTKGEENQAYSITAYSDDDWNLLIEK